MLVDAIHQRAVQVEEEGGRRIRHLSRASQSSSRFLGWLGLARSSFLFSSLGLLRRRLRRVSGLDRNLFELALREWNRDVENSILEFGASVLDVRSIRQGDRTVELSIAPLGSTNSTLRFFPLDAAFASDNQHVIIDLDRDILLGEARKFRRDDKVAVTKCHFNWRRPNQCAEIIGLGSLVSARLAEGAAEFLLHIVE